MSSSDPCVVPGNGDWAGRREVPIGRTHRPGPRLFIMTDDQKLGITALERIAICRYRLVRGSLLPFEADEEGQEDRATYETERDLLIALLDDVAALLRKRLADGLE